MLYRPHRPSSDEVGMPSKRPVIARTKPRQPVVLKAARRPAAGRVARDAPRRAEAGDTAPVLEPGAIEDFTVDQAGAAADEVTAGAIRDLLEGVNPGDAARILRSVLEQQQ